jgi:hypothetical protein
MKVRLSSAALIVFGVAWTAFAQMQSPMREGNWEVIMKMTIPGMTMDMPPMKQTHCVTAEMIKDPMASVPKGPGGGDCKVSDYTFTGSTASYKMTCTKPAPMTAVGEMKYSGTDAYTGTLVVDSGGQKMSMAYDAKRLGDCPK